ncbi:MAG: dihydrodipicolinate synthase family protein [Alphaproteobacteria bacterium]|nr:dihydrodipicolinate synthase family protein [Alphaproteobacteria bacterium]
MGGIIAAVPTPFDGKNQPLLDEFISHCHWALNNGCDGLNILGTTGEANSQSVANRQAIMKVAAEKLDVSKLMVGTGLSDLATTADLTLFANDLGYPVALILPPFYYNPISEQGIIDYFSALDKQLGYAEIKIYLYNFPALSGVKFSVEVIKQFAQKMPHRIAGIKDSSGDIAYCQEIVKAVPNFKVFPSNEISVAEAKQNGFAGCISGSVNVTAPLATKLWNGVGNKVELSEKIAELRTEIASLPLIQAVKYLVGLRENNSNWNSVIPPLVGLSEVQIQQVETISKKLKQL